MPLDNRPIENELIEKMVEEKDRIDLLHAMLTITIQQMIQHCEHNREVSEWKMVILHEQSSIPLLFANGDDSNQGNLKSPTEYREKRCVKCGNIENEYR